MKTMVLRTPLVSARLAPRAVLVNLVLLLGVVTLLGQGLFGGSYPVTAADVWTAVQGQADPVTQMIVMDHRLPRLLMALGVGLALGMAGDMVQSLLRNPLASPDIIGFTAGASVGAVLSVAMLGSAVLVMPAALAGGLLAATLVIALSWNRGLRPGQVVLIGIGVTLTLSVLSDLLMTRIEANSAYELTKWLVGSLAARSLADVTGLWLTLLVLGPVVLWHQFTLSRATLDDPVAIGLGLSLTRARLVTLVLAVALIALAVGAAGPLPFVAFVAGPVAHGLSRGSLPNALTAGLVGATITLLADMASQSLPGGLRLPAGVFTALTGAPVLIWVLIRQSRKQHS